MTKQEFFKELKFALRSHEYQDVEEILDYYEELFMERRERGESEEEIVSSFDPIEVIAENFSEELSKKEGTRINKEQIQAAADKGKRQFKDVVDTGVKKAKEIADKSAKLAKEVADKSVKKAKEVADKSVKKAKSAAKGAPSAASYWVRVPVGICLVFVMIVIAPIAAGVMAAMWATVGATIVAGIAEMLASVVILFVAESPMVAFAALGVGALCAGLGFILITPCRYLTKGLALVLMYLGKAIGRVFAGKRVVAVEEDDYESI